MTEKVGRKKMKTASRKAQLMQIAAKVFSREGYTETNIESISNEAGMTGPAIYRHFSSKQQILDTICVSGIESALEAAREIYGRKGANPEETLKKLIESRIDHSFGPMSASFLLAASQKAHLSHAAREKVSVMQREFRDICGSLLRKIKPEADEVELKAAVFAVQCMNTYTTWQYKDRDLLTEEELKLLLQRINWHTLLG